MRPSAAVISQWNDLDAVGELTLDDGRTLRFGATACHGFRPERGMQVFVLAIGPHPLGGERALSVRDEPISDEEAARRAEAKATAARERALAPIEKLAAELAPAPLPDGYEPRIDEIDDLLLPRTRALMEAVRSSSLEWLGELFYENPPWSFFDPSLRGFGADGGGNVWALHVYPPRLEAGEPAPVVFWDHEQHVHLYRAESFERFLAMLLHDAMRDEPERRQEAETLARRLSIDPSPPTEDWERWEPMDEAIWPLPRAAHAPMPTLAPSHMEERRLARSLVESTFGQPDRPDPAAFHRLGSAYEELGWTGHFRSLHYQAHDWLAQRRLWALHDLQREPNRV